MDAVVAFYVGFLREEDDSRGGEVILWTPLKKARFVIRSSCIMNRCIKDMLKRIMEDDAGGRFLEFILRVIVIWSYYDNVKEAILLHNALSRQTKDAG
ncbi:hypothetical protein Tco_0987440 [Tanacetum coccineum]|uniref:Uncharacterized protein n=1 Tax=Tanacetum coccineum TaxID=301880 RepID=A0ABQ5J1N3_9ASTR